MASWWTPVGFKPNPTAPQTESHRSSVTSHRQKESEIIMMDAKTTNLTSRPPNVFIADAFYLNVCEAINHFPTEGDPDDLADGYLTIYSFYSCVTPSVWGGVSGVGGWIGAVGSHWGRVRCRSVRRAESSPSRVFR